MRKPTPIDYENMATYVQEAVAVMQEQFEELKAEVQKIKEMVENEQSTIYEMGFRDRKPRI